MISDLEKIKSKLKLLPNEPGIYKFLNSKNIIIYVGKSKNIKKRVSSYFNKNVDNFKTKRLVSQVFDIHYTITFSEIDALLLENSFIKNYQPKYNILLKDDKTYPWIALKTNPFPYVYKTRKKLDGNIRYYGPYTSVKHVNTIIDLLHQLYPFKIKKIAQARVLNKFYDLATSYHQEHLKSKKSLEKLEYDYKEYIRTVDTILKGNYSPVKTELNKKMLEFSLKYKFEEAQEVKEKIEALNNFQIKTKVVSSVINNVDVISIINDDEVAYVNYLIVKKGVIIHANTVEVKKKLDETASSILSFCLLNFREQYQSVSREIISLNLFTIPQNLKIHIPQRGEKKKLLEVSERNVKMFRLERLKSDKIKNPQKHIQRILSTIKKDLRLRELPVHIECFDNSNFQGTNAVGACVVFKNTKPSKKEYRNFNIKTVNGPDDFASMEEVVYRRYSRLLKDEKELPQLIVIDGGKGQLNSAVKSLKKLNLYSRIAIIGIAKRLEEIYFPNDSIPIYLDKRSESLKVIQHLRNEAHRFGITHHRRKRSKNAINSELTNIKGIGSKTFEQLILHFKSLKRIKQATFDEIEDVIGKSKARIITEYFD